MAKRYRLHLSDGTILVVDHDSLGTWLVDRRATVQLEGSKQWLPLREFLAAEREAEFRASPRKRARTREELPLIPPPPKKSDKPSVPEPKPTPEPVIPPPAPEPTPAKPEPPPPTPPPPPREEAPRREEPARWVPPEPVAKTPIGQPEGVEPLASAPASPPKRRSPRSRPDDSIQPIPLVPLDETPLTRAVPLAQETAGATPPSRDDGLSEDGETAPEPCGHDLPVIPLKPLPDEERPRVPAWLEPREAHRFVPDEEPAEPRASLQHADVVFLRTMARLGGALSRLLDSLTRYQRRQRSRRAATRGVPVERSVSAEARATEPIRPTAPPRLAAAWRNVGERLSAGIAQIVALRRSKAEEKPQSLGELLASAIPRPAHRPKPAPEPPPAVPPAEESTGFDETFEAPPAEDRPRRRPHSTELPPSSAPPTPLAEMPVLRLRETPKVEEEEAGELYDGEYHLPGEEGAASRLLQALGTWTKRLILAAVLVGGGLWAALTWETWFPRAGEVGEKALSKIDDQVRSMETEKQREQALQAAVEQMPQLAPETIRLLLSRGDALEVLEIFQVANDAADRGAMTLTPEEQRELAALRDELLAGLPAADREQLGEYQRARVFGLVLPSEERASLARLARGARAMAPDHLARLRALLAKAIAAGLSQPPPAATH